MFLLHLVQCLKTHLLEPSLLLLHLVQFLEQCSVFWLNQRSKQTSSITERHHDKKKKQNYTTGLSSALKFKITLMFRRNQNGKVKDFIIKKNDLGEWLSNHRIDKQEHLRLPVESLSTWGISPTELSARTCSPLVSTKADDFIPIF